MTIETAAGVIARDMARQYFEQFGIAIRRNRHTGQDVSAAHIDTLAGTLALIIAGGHGSYWEVLTATEKKLRNAVERDLRHLKPT